MPSSVLAAWRFAPEADVLAPVLPDGCRDLIVRLADNERAQWLVSELSDSVCHVPSRAGELFVGYRFRPGSVVRENRLLDSVRGKQDADAAEVLSAIDDCVRVDSRLVDALESLAAAGSVGLACRRLGVSERSLERLLQRQTGRPPAYWRSLARVRRAAAGLSARAPLAEIALDHGYADQAHMSREFRKWFGVSPRRLRASPQLLLLAAEAGYR